MIDFRYFLNKLTLTFSLFLLNKSNFNNILIIFEVTH